MESAIKNGFLKYVSKQVCPFQETDQDLKDIEHHVLTLVKKLLNKVTENDSFFKIKEVFPTESFYEETKIRSPDEFDFMVVLDPSAFANSVTLDSKCKTSPWFRNINANIDSSTTKIIVIETRRTRAPWSAEKEFWKEMKNIIDKTPVVVPTFYGELRTKYVKYHKLFLEYTQKQRLQPECDEPTTQSQDTVRPAGLVVRCRVEIGVDLMLAFKHPSLNDILQNDVFPKEHETLLLNNGCHLVAKSCPQTKTKYSPSSYGGDFHNTRRCDCWFISFAAMETEKMKDLDNSHKNFYKILKAILIGSVNYPGKCMNLSSYMLKNAFLYHVYRDDCKEKSFISCIPRILDYLITGFQNVEMPCFFARDLNVWGKVVVAPVLAEFSCHSEKEPAVHSMLWVEFWRRVILVFKDLLFKQKDQNQWVRQSEKIDCLRTLTTFMLEEYYKSKQAESFLLEGDPVAAVPFNTVSPFVKSLIPRYIKEWQTIVKCEKFDIEELVKVEPCT